MCIVFDDTMGHRAEYLIKGEEINKIEKNTEPATEQIESRDPSSDVVQIDMKQIKILRINRSGVYTFYYSDTGDQGR